MTVNSPWDKPARKKPKRGRAKKVAKKRKKKAKKKAGRRAPRVRGARIVVSKTELDKIRKNAARPKWFDMLPENKRKVFKHKGKAYWPLYSLLYMVDAVEVVPLAQWSGPTSTKAFGALLKPGFVKKIGSRKYVYVEHTQFIQKGSPIDVA